MEPELIGRLKAAWASLWRSERDKYVEHLETENAELRARLNQITDSLIAGLGMPVMSPVAPERKTMPVVPRVRVPSLQRQRFEAEARRENPEEKTG